MKIYIQKKQLNGDIAEYRAVGHINTNQNAAFQLSLCDGNMSFEDQSIDGTVGELIVWIRENLAHLKKYNFWKYKKDAIAHAENVLIPKLQTFDQNLIVSFNY